MIFPLVIRDLLSKPPKNGGTHIIAIDGRAGAGKTTLSSDLSLALSSENSVNVIHLDEIYEGWDKALSQSLTENLKEILISFSKGQGATLSIFDWSLGSFTSTRQVPQADVLIIEGVGSAQKVVRRVATATIWLDVPSDVGLRRVLERDGNSITQEMLTWQIQEEAHFQADETRENCDFILSTS